ncbi:MAG: cytochrome c3 family protein [Methylotenera sp.]|uniref:cytochrome c3 family protein n=1 Tax=Methylotenera sp. TaxID=2051956 RepID=UPI002488BF55|nr:cytochrome c3 family protein [Methylotenera sp.]MDI1307944.1 cytochrome c3 family protein [Methylotenera sp.]
MINCLLIKISLNKRGMPVRSYRTLTAEELSIGRGAECNIHLLDPRISMHHAVIKRLDDGQLHLVSVNGELEVDGAILQNTALTHGTQVMIGPFQLKVEPAPPDVNIAVSLTLVHLLPDDFQNLKARTHEPLRGASIFKKRLAISLVAFIALIFLVLPLAQNLIPNLHATMAKLPLGFDRLWSPGHISNSHLHFGSQCFNCHEVLTQQVSDQACIKCHLNVAPHIADPKLQEKVFNHNKLFMDGIRCAECHREHKSPFPLARQDNSTCVKCHGNIKSVDKSSKLPNIHDFNRDHPAFKLTFLTGDLEKKIERIPQTDKARLVEKSGIKFPHSQHFGKVQGPNGIWDIREMTCTNCHQQEGKEMRFKPVSYNRDCVTCHANQLTMGPPETLITVPHGSEQNVMNTLKVQAPKQLAHYSESLRTDGCAYCHEINDFKAKTKTQVKVDSKGKANPDDDLPWHVAPLNINQDWFSKARFNHASHQTQKCQSCHAVEESESSADVAMPDRQSCLRCHSGNSPKPKRIASSCMSCHDFHDSHVMHEALAESK